MATPIPTPIEPKRSTAEDTLQQKSRDANVVSGGHLVAKALKNEGVDTIFTLCGGHIIDIYDGCVDEGVSSMSAMSRWPPMPRTATPARPGSWVVS